jgi:hypothetical protein
LIIVDLTQIQERKPNPQIPEISRLTWPTMTVPQVAHPVTIDGKPYLVEVDEYSSGEDGDGVSAHGPRVGAARIIDISDETKPRVVSNVRLEVHQPENRQAIADDYGAQNPTQGYAAHYCNVPRREDPGIMACSMILSGLRVFDIRDPEQPKEIAYFVAPPDTISTTGGPVIDERANWAMSQPDFVPERGEIWYSDGTSGFYVLKVSPDVWPFQSSAQPPESGPTDPDDGDSPGGSSPDDDAGQQPGGSQGGDPRESQRVREEVAGGEGDSDRSDGGLPFTGFQLALVALCGALLGLGGWAIRRGVSRSASRHP